MNAIEVEGLCKRYRLGIHRAGYNTLRDVLARVARTPRPAAAADEHWALRDVSFVVGEGEVVGPVAADGQYAVYRLAAKRGPDSADARLRGLLARRILGAHLARLVDRHVTWIVPVGD